MNESSATGNQLVFVRRALNLWLPASMNLGIASILAPAMNALLARAPNPEASIAGYAIALGVISIVALPQFRIQQLTLVFLTDRRALGSLRRFVAAISVIVGSVSFVVAFTPVSGMLLEGVFSAKGELLIQAQAGLAVLSPLPVLLVARTHLYGAALRLGKPRLVWIGTGIGAGGAVGMGAALLAVGVQGAIAAGTATTLAALVETIVLIIATHGPLRHELREWSTDGDDTSLGAIGRFFAPLIVAAFLPAATTPVLNAALARSANPEASIAAFAISLGLFQALTLLLWGAQPTILALLARGDSMRRVTVFTNSVAAVVLGIALVAAFVPPITTILVQDLSGARDRLAELSVLGLRVLAPMPLILVQEQVFASALMQVRRTRPIMYVNFWRLLALLVFVFVTYNLVEIPGVAIGAGAWAASLAVEALATCIYGHGAFRRLVAVRPIVSQQPLV